MKRPRIIVFFTAFTLLLTALHAQKSHAQYDEKFKITESEKAVFAFKKLSGDFPDYESMIAHMKTYQNAPSSADQREIYEENSVRLQIGWQRYNVKHDYLSIKTDIILKLRDDTEKPTLNFKFVNTQDLIVPYFPYPFGDDWIAVVVKNLEHFTSLTLSGEQYDSMKNIFDPGEIYNGKLHLQLRPISTDSKAPMPIDGTNHWLMMADIAHLEFIARNPKTGKNKSLGTYQAKWYKKPENE